MIEEEIKITDIFKGLWLNKLKISLVTLIFAISSIFFSLSIPNNYSSSALLVSAFDESNSLSKLNNQLGSLAAISGISLNTESSSKVSIGIEMIKSFDFFVSLVEKYDFLVPLMASQNWDPRTMKLQLNSNIYDPVSNKWVRRVSFPKTLIPSYQEAHKEFLEKLSISENKQNGLIKISINHVSPIIARDWVNWIVIEINETTRQKAILKAENSINYLKNEVNLTKFSDIRNDLNRLIESQIEIIMLANATPDYLFQIVESPIVSEFKAGPPRALICILGTIFGFVSSIVLSLIINISFRSNEINS